MAVRLTLILSQPCRRDAAAIDLLENIVAAAILVPGLDANLVGDLSVIELGSTDYLCLEAHKRDLVLAGFLDLSEAELAWKNLGFSGIFADFDADDETIKSVRKGAGGSRIVFYFRLSTNHSGPKLLDKCQRLLVAQRISLVSIELSPKAAQSYQASPSQPSTPKSPTAHSSASEPSTMARISLPIWPAKSISPAEKAAIPSTAPRSHEESEEHDWAELDKLVDDLGDLDL